jgi:hypothetical protein
MSAADHPASRSQSAANQQGNQALKLPIFPCEKSGAQRFAEKKKPA